jgi:hypothetical protein
MYHTSSLFLNQLLKLAKERFLHGADLAYGLMPYRHRLQRADLFWHRNARYRFQLIRAIERT